jgi:hypothetical protein
VAAGRILDGTSCDHRGGSCSRHCAWGAWSVRRSAASAARSAEEARRIRLDNLGPQVFIEDPEPLRERWNVSPTGGADHYPPGVAMPGTSFESPGNDALRLLTGANLTIKNQRNLSVRLSMTGAYRLDRPQVLDTEEIQRFVQDGQHVPETRLPDTGITVGPGDALRVLARTGLS